MVPAPISSASLVAALMWAVFIGCLAALFAYDTFSWLLRLASRLVDKWTHSGGSNE